MQESMMNSDTTNEVIIYEDENNRSDVQVQFDGDNVWLKQDQISQLFEKDRTVITKHINNILKDKEVEEKSNVQKMHIANSDKPVKFYSLDIILAVGYRTNSKKAISFRKWATNVLKDHLVKGYSVNQKRLQQKGLGELERTITLLRETIDTSQLELSEAKGLLDVILNYSRTWTLLQGYDEDSLKKNITVHEEKFILDFDEAKDAIAQLKKELMSKGEASDLFGKEKAGEFDGVIRNIYQTFGGVDLIPSVEEKAANLLYYIIKDHPFNDGNKRIGAFLFILFLTKNNTLYKSNGELKINDNALVALSLMTAKSDPIQKDTVVNLIVNMLGE